MSPDLSLDLSCDLSCELSFGMHYERTPSRQGRWFPSPSDRRGGSRSLGITGCLGRVGALVVLSCSPGPAEASICSLAAPSSYGNPLLQPKTPAHLWVAGVCRDLKREAADEVPLTPLPTPSGGPGTLRIAAALAQLCIVALCHCCSLMYATPLA